MGSYYQTMHQYFLLIGLSLALAAPAADEAPYGPPPAPVYKAKPAPYKEPDYKPQPYEYKYGVADDYSKSSFDKVETQDEYGKVQGSYKIALPDGRIQIVSYVSDENGYQADVTYEGEPVYPAPRRVRPLQGTRRLPRAQAWRIQLNSDHMSYLFIYICFINKKIKPSLVD